MSVNIRIPTTLRTLTAGESEVTVEGSTVLEALNNLEASHAGFVEKILDESGEAMRFVNIFLDDEDTKFMQGTQTQVSDGQTISLVPAVAGG